TQENVHEIARKADPRARVVYVDNDPIAVAHSRLILRDIADVAVIEADLRDPVSVIGHPDLVRLIDFTKPVGLLAINVLQFVSDPDDPVGVVSGFTNALVPGSYLAISHVTQEPAPVVTALIQDLYKSTSAPIYARTKTEILQLLKGFDLVEPGLVYVPLWRPDDKPPKNPERAWLYAGVGRKR
ncbi:MAG: SAM-dependent methyltransferase, partial [Nocardiopsaceae bacterium]|nr:SAM-dependent methyltransferase [Nocardiopsaceae bacterium]